MRRSPRALATLKASDRTLAALIEKTDPIDPGAWRRARPLDDAFSVLVYSIIGQQISGFAAQAIAGRLREHFGGRMPTPAELLATDAATLRTVGLSRMKIEYLHSLAQHVIAGDLQIDRLQQLPDEEVRTQITACKGLGRWTADMFLLINLERPDVLPVGDPRHPHRRSAPLQAGSPSDAEGSGRHRRKTATEPQPGKFLFVGVRTAASEKTRTRSCAQANQIGNWRAEREIDTMEGEPRAVRWLKRADCPSRSE